MHVPRLHFPRTHIPHHTPHTRHGTPQRCSSCGWRRIVPGDWEHGAELVAEWNAMRGDAELVETTRTKCDALRDMASRVVSQQNE